MNNLPDNNEKKWGAMLKNAKHVQKKAGNQIPLDIQRKNLDEEIAHYKVVLKKSLKENNRTETKRSLRELIKRRAKLTVLNLETHKEDNFFVSSEKKEEEIKNYFIQCHKLNKAAALLAQQKNGNKQY